MSRIFPSLTLASGLDVSKLSHDQNVVKAYIDDPLVHDRVSARWFTEIMAAMERINASPERIKVPILMQLAGDDHLTDANASKAFFEKLKLEDKTLYVYEGLYHEIYNELEGSRAKPLKDLVAWFEARR